MDKMDRFIDRGAICGLSEPSQGAQIHPFASVAGFEAQVQNEPCHIYAADWDGDGDADFMHLCCQYRNSASQN